MVAHVPVTHNKTEMLYCVLTKLNTSNCILSLLIVICFTLRPAIRVVVHVMIATTLSSARLLTLVCDRHSGPPFPGRLKSMPDAKMSSKRFDIFSDDVVPVQKLGLDFVTHYYTGDFGNAHISNIFSTSAILTKFYLDFLPLNL